MQRLVCWPCVINPTLRTHLAMRLSNGGVIGRHELAFKPTQAHSLGHGSNIARSSRLVSNFKFFLRSLPLCKVTRISIVPPSNINSNSSHRPHKAQQRSPVYPALPPGARKKTPVPFAVHHSLYCGGCRPSFHERS